MTTIMLVDDDQDVADLFAEFLADAGFVVDVFTKGLVALNSCVDCRYAMVVADVNMPDIDGLSLLRMIRAQRPHMPYIIMSGAEIPDDSDVAKAADAFHLKYEHPAELAQKVLAVLASKGVNAGASQELAAI